MYVTEIGISHPNAHLMGKTNDDPLELGLSYFQTKPKCGLMWHTGFSAHPVVASLADSSAKIPTALLDRFCQSSGCFSIGSENTRAHIHQPTFLDLIPLFGSCKSLKYSLDLPVKLTVCYGKTPFLRGRSTINDNFQELC